MSVVIRTPEGLGGEPSKIMLYSKGADMMMERDCNVAIPDWARTHLMSCVFISLFAHLPTHHFRSPSAHFRSTLWAGPGEP